MWITIVTAALMLSSWLLLRANPKRNFDGLFYDLENIQKISGLACNSLTFHTNYNPRTEEGLLDIGSSACINSSGFYYCLALVCDFENSSFNLSNVIELEISKNKTGKPFVKIASGMD